MRENGRDLVIPSMCALAMFGMWLLCFFGLERLQMGAVGYNRAFPLDEILNLRHARQLVTLSAVAMLFYFATNLATLVVAACVYGLVWAVQDRESTEARFLTWRPDTPHWMRRASRLLSYLSRVTYSVGISFVAVTTGNLVTQIT
jgi:hypothetical protein